MNVPSSIVGQNSLPRSSPLSEMLCHCSICILRDFRSDLLHPSNATGNTDNNLAESANLNSGESSLLIQDQVFWIHTEQPREPRPQTSVHTLFLLRVYPRLAMHLGGKGRWHLYAFELSLVYIQGDIIKTCASKQTNKQPTTEMVIQGFISIVCYIWCPLCVAYLHLLAW